MRAGVSTLNGAEQLAFNQFARERGAVDLDDAAAGTFAHRVDEIRHDFFAGAALAGHQNRHVTGSHPLDGADDVLHRRAVENRG